MLVLTCDDLGVSYSSNSAIYDSLRTGVASSAGLVVPGPWARRRPHSYRGEDVGAHLTLNAEYDLTAGHRSPTPRRYWTGTGASLGHW